MIYAWLSENTFAATGELENVPLEYRDSVVLFPHLEWPKDVEKLIREGDTIREKTEAEIKREKLDQALAAIRAERDRRLAATDWVVLRAADQGVPPPPEWIDYRQALRDLPQTLTEEQILSGEIPWPEPPVR